MKRIHKHVEPTRTREQGRVVTHATTPQERIDAIRRIVDNRTFAKVDGVTIDLFTAGVIVQVYDALSETNRVNFASRDPAQMAVIAFKLIELS